MITSLSWIKNHLSTKADIKQITERLTEIGLEVESVKSPDGNLDNFIICKVVKSQKHPNADKLKLCDVDIGKTNLVKVVCGAQNAIEGLFTVYAPPGAIIPKNKMELTPEIDLNFIFTALIEKFKHEKITIIDGLKIDFEEGWVHLRKSNTEPIIRIYSESKGEDKANALAENMINEIKKLI